MRRYYWNDYWKIPSIRNPKVQFQCGVQMCQLLLGEKGEFQQTEADFDTWGNYWAVQKQGRKQDSVVNNGAPRDDSSAGQDLQPVVDGVANKIQPRQMGRNNGHTKRGCGDWVHIIFRSPEKIISIQDEQEEQALPMSLQVRNKERRQITFWFLHLSTLSTWWTSWGVN